MEIWSSQVKSSSVALAALLEAFFSIYISIFADTHTCTQTS